MLRLTVLDLCRLVTIGCPLRCRLSEWPSRESVTNGMLSLCVSVPRSCETLETLAVWPLRPFGIRTSRRQLMTTSLRLRLCPRWCVCECSLSGDSVGALLTQTWSLPSTVTVSETCGYLLLVRLLAWRPRRPTWLSEETRWKVSREVDTLTENMVIVPLAPSVVHLLTPSVRVAPFTDGCVVRTTRLLGRRFVATRLRLMKLAGRLAMVFPPLQWLRSRWKVLPIVLRTGMKFRCLCVWVLVTLKTPCLVALISLRMAWLLGRKVPLVTLLLVLTSRCRIDPLWMTLVQVMTPVVSGAVPVSLTMQCELLMSLLRFRVLNYLLSAIVLVDTLCRPSLWTVWKTSRRLWWQKLSLLTPLVM